MRNGAIKLSYGYMNLFNNDPVKILLCACIIILSVKCTINDESSQDYERWTSSDPFAINYRIREQKFNQGNLLPNNSFESGRVIEVDPLTHTTKIDGWDLIGKDVVWIHPGNDTTLADSAEIHKGYCSIRIIRESAGETEGFGQGVLSNFIKVIPGNYRLSFYLKLAGIKNPKSRLGTGLYDAIDIKVICYDRNKVQIDGDFYAPYYNTIIDNSFKGLSFANYTSIDSTGWMHVLGRSHLFPFPDGDLQDETKFVRIFIGLKGTGGMWIDDVQFQYTRWNFTAMERLSPYLDTTLAKGKLITPLPRKVEILESIIYYRPYYKDLFPVVLVPESADRLTLKAARLLENKIKEMLVALTDISRQDIPDLVKTENTFFQNEASVIFSLGLTKEMKNNNKLFPLETIKGRKKGFMIQTLDNQGHIIFLYGNSPEANYYAVQTAIQLFDNKRLLFHNANIIDFPSNQDFGLLLQDNTDYAVNYLQSTGNTRFGSIYLPSGDSGIIRILRNDLRYTSFSKWLYVSYMPDELDDIDYSQISDKIDGVAFLYDTISFDIGINDIIRNFYTENENCNFRTMGNLTAAIQKTEAYNLDIELMPHYTSNLSLNKMIFSRANFFEYITTLNFNIPVIWSGYQFQSWQVDEADLMYFKLYTRGPIVFFDYSLLPRSNVLNYFANDTVYPSKLLSSCLFEPFTNEVVHEVYQDVAKTVVIYKVSDVFDKIRLQTTSDYFWNPENYNPDLSLFRALVSEFGENIAKSLIYYNDAYFKIYSDILLTRVQKNPNKYHRRIVTCLNEIYKVQEKLEKDPYNVKNPELLQLLKSLTADMERQAEQSGLVLEIK